MSQESQQASPLSLYQQAYRLHYSEKKISQACDIYETLVREFPESEVSSYAAVQLEKLRTTGVLKKLKRGNNTLTVIATIFAIVSFVAVLGMGGFGLYYYALSQQKSLHSSMALRALAKLAAQQDEEALSVLRELKIVSRNDITPFALSAEIYRKNNDFLRARKEYEDYRRIYPNGNIPESEIALLNEDEDKFITNTIGSNTKKSIPEDVIREAEKKSAVRKRTKPKRSRPKKKKPKLLVPVDSISYF